MQGPEITEPLTTLRQSCHLNIAACDLLRQRDFDNAVRHCTLALGTGAPAVEVQLKALLRRADAHKQLGNFSQGLQDLGQARDLSTADSSAHQAIMRRIEHMIFTSNQFATEPAQLLSRSGANDSTDTGTR